MLTSRRLGKEPQLQKAAQNAPALAQGARGNGVAAMQDGLADLGYDLRTSTTSTGFDGVFGQETGRAVRRFQSENALASDGVAGRMTLHRLDAVLIARGLDERDPAEVKIQDVSDRMKPVPLRRNSNY